ncbi:MAG: pseudouridine synthase [Cyanobium sp. CACIAM 14]|nr:MAG: pseudouridine synthase [Cyanobium sp. CACIAM 14]
MEPSATEGGLATEGWLPPGVNGGWIYRDRIAADAAGQEVSAFYAGRYRHSQRQAWQRRLASGEIERNGERLGADALLAVEDRLAWHRPPWWEPAVPAGWRVVFDDGDLHVIDKPAGLPVLPAGGFLEHTVLRLLERRHGADPAGVPRPVHRLGRFTSGLLVCARRPGTRAWLSAQLRESTASLSADGCPSGQRATPCQNEGGVNGCRKIYRAWLVPGDLALAIGESLLITTPIGRRSHPLLGAIWCAVETGQPDALPSLSRLTLLERGREADVVEVAIATGRPHQIRIHCAAVGAPLLGDPLYVPGGLARPGALPGEGGYRLRAQRLCLSRPDGSPLALEAALPEGPAAVATGCHFVHPMASDSDAEPDGPG